MLQTALSKKLNDTNNDNDDTNDDDTNNNDNDNNDDADEEDSSNSTRTSQIGNEIQYFLASATTSPAKRSPTKRAEASTSGTTANTDTQHTTDVNTDVNTNTNTTATAIATATATSTAVSPQKLSPQQETEAQVLKDEEDAEVVRGFNEEMYDMNEAIEL
eukprot:m.87311 g.87311  ORF g.87311 m.87311 type:complete len:160 (-) comp26058_c0_seq1:78-557(-)